MGARRPNCFVGDLLSGRGTVNGKNRTHFMDHA